MGLKHHGTTDCLMRPLGDFEILEVFGLGGHGVGGGGGEGFEGGATGMHGRKE